MSASAFVIASASGVMIPDPALRHPLNSSLCVSGFGISEVPSTPYQLWYAIVAPAAVRTGIATGVEYVPHRLPFAACEPQP